MIEEKDEAGETDLIDGGSCVVLWNIHLEYYRVFPYLNSPPRHPLG